MSVSEPLQQPIAKVEGEVFSSVYVRNLAPSTQIADMDQVVKVFVCLKTTGIAIKSRKDTRKVFAFIDFKEASGVQNAAKKARLMHMFIDLDARYKQEARVDFSEEARVEFSDWINEKIIPCSR